MPFFSKKRNSRKVNDKALSDHFVDVNKMV